MFQTTMTFDFDMVSLYPFDHLVDLSEETHPTNDLIVDFDIQSLYPLINSQNPDC